MILSHEADSYELTYSARQKAMSEQHDKKKSTALGKRGRGGGGNHNSALYLNDNHRADFSLMATHYFFMFNFNEWIKMNIRM